MPEKFAVVNIGQLVTMAGPARARVGVEMRELGLMRDAALLVENGRVQAAGLYPDLRASIDLETEVIDAEGRLVTPGFVDAHTHLVFAGNRAAEFEKRIGGATYQEIAAKWDGRSLVTDEKTPHGGKFSRTFDLAPNGQQLYETVRIDAIAYGGAKSAPQVYIQYVYDADQEAPR